MNTATTDRQQSIKNIFLTDVEDKVEKVKMVCDISETAKWVPYRNGTLSSKIHQLTTNVLHVPV